MSVYVTILIISWNIRPTICQEYTVIIFANLITFNSYCLNIIYFYDSYMLNRSQFQCPYLVSTVEYMLLNNSRITCTQHK